MNIAVCIATYRRPLGLKKILDSLDRMNTEGMSVTIFVVENDPVNGEGLSFLQENAGGYKNSILFDVEEGVGISHARNKSLRMVRDSGTDFDYIAFTDDDTEASYHWLHDMAETIEFYNADVVFGKVEFKFAVRPASEILSSPYFTKENGGPATGTAMINGGTNNVILSASIFDKQGWEVFDPKLSLSGSEDKDLFISLHRHGYKMVYCASAVIYEIFPEERLNADWLLNRYHRRGSTEAYLLKKWQSKKGLYRVAIKRMPRAIAQYIRYKLSPSIGRKCYLYDSVGFFEYIFNQRLFEEYRRKKNDKSVH